mgnify:CR=1 FL=1
MSYVDPFGGQPASPSFVGFRAVSLSANAILYWPWANQNTTDLAAKIMEVTPTSGGFTMTLPSALQAGTGEAILFINLGASSFTVLDAAGGAVVTVAPSIGYYVFLTDNSTLAGSWTAFQYGAAGSSVDASALAGSGLTVIASMLALNLTTVQNVNNYTLLTSDRAKHFYTTTSSGAFTYTLLPAVTAGNGFFFMVSNIGTGAITIDPDGGELIDGAATLSVNPGESVLVNCSGAGWYTVGRGRSTVFVQTRLVKSVAGSSNVTLTTTEAGNIIQSYTGLLTGNISVIVPTAVAIYFVYNNTTGAFTLTVKTSAGTGIQVTQSKRTILYCDGTNVVDADDESVATSFAMADGSAPSPGLAFQADTDTGFFRPGANQLGIAAGGVSQLVADASGANVTGAQLRLQGTDIVPLMLVIG